MQKTMPNSELYSECHDKKAETCFSNEVIQKKIKGLQRIMLSQKIKEVHKTRAFLERVKTRQRGTISILPSTVRHWLAQRTQLIYQEGREMSKVRHAHKLACLERKQMNSSSTTRSTQDRTPQLKNLS